MDNSKKLQKKPNSRVDNPWYSRGNLRKYQNIWDNCQKILEKFIKILFNNYGEGVMRAVTSEREGGIFIGGKRINILRYADDRTLFAESM